MRTEKEPREGLLQSTVTKIIAPIAEISSQGSYFHIFCNYKSYLTMSCKYFLIESTALRISKLQNELRLLQKSLQEQSVWYLCLKNDFKYNNDFH